MIPDDDPSEVAELEAVAEWRLRQVDADPTDAQSAARGTPASGVGRWAARYLRVALLTELHALCGWLDESDNITDFSLRAHDSLADRFRPPGGECRGLSAWLIELAKDAM